MRKRINVNVGGESIAWLREEAFARQYYTGDLFDDIVEQTDPDVLNIDDKRSRRRPGVVRYQPMQLSVGVDTLSKLDELAATYDTGRSAVVRAILDHARHANNASSR